MSKPLSIAIVKYDPDDPGLDRRNILNHLHVKLATEFQAWTHLVVGR